MEIYKRPQSLLIVFLIFLTSCGNINEESVIEELEEENLELSIHAKRQQELLKDWFDDFQTVQKEIFSINTNELLLLKLKLEGPNRQQSDRKRIIEKVKKVKTLLNLKDDELYELRKRIQEIGDGNVYFNEVIRNLKYEVRNLENDVRQKNNEMGELQYRYYTALRNNDSLNQQIRVRLNEIETLQNENYQLKKELNEKFIIHIAKKEMKLIPIHSDNIPPLNYKITDIEILSYHPRNSYELTKRDKSTGFHIYNSERFWSESNYIIIRIKKRRLN